MSKRSNEETSNDLNKDSGKNKGWKYALYIAFVLIATGFAIWISLSNDASEIYSYLSSMDIKWILVIIGLMLFVTFIKGVIYYCFARLYTKNYKLRQGIALEEVGVFYSAITPGASGGEFAQAYTYKKQGIHVSNAVSIMAMYSIIYQLVLVIFGVISFICEHDLITSLGNISITIGSGSNPFTLSLSILPLAIIGFILNIGVIGIVLLMGYWHGFHNFIMGNVIGFLYKIKLVKNIDKTRENLRISVENFKLEFTRLLTNVPFFILSIILLSIIMMVRGAIPYVIGLALGNEGSGNLFESIWLSNFHQMTTGLIPLPGSAGISEYFFHQLFFNSTGKSFFADESMCRAALLLWRSITFVIPLLIAGFVTAFYRCSPKDEESFRDVPNRGTFVELQKETFFDRADDLASLENQLNKHLILKKLYDTRNKLSNNPEDELNDTTKLNKDDLKGNGGE